MAKRGVFVNLPQVEENKTPLPHFSRLQQIKERELSGCFRGDLVVGINGVHLFCGVGKSIELGDLLNQGLSRLHLLLKNHPSQRLRSQPDKIQSVQEFGLQMITICVHLLATYSKIQLQPIRL